MKEVHWRLGRISYLRVGSVACFEIGRVQIIRVGRAIRMRRFSAPTVTPWPADADRQLGDPVEKKGRARWRGHVVGWYRTDLTALGYAVESAFESGSVQIYPATALITWEPEA